MRTMQNGLTIKNRLRLPHSIGNDNRIAVICADDGPVAKAALAAGAVLVGEESLFELIRANKIDFDVLLCDSGSLAALEKAKLNRLLGPKGLYPTTKKKTVTSNVVSAMQEMASASP